MSAYDMYAQLICMPSQYDMYRPSKFVPQNNIINFEERASNQMLSLDFWKHLIWSAASTFLGALSIIIRFILPLCPIMSLTSKWCTGRTINCIWYVCPAKMISMLSLKIECCVQIYINRKKNGKGRNEQRMVILYSQPASIYIYI
jgi:hypothetical protein